MKSEKSTQSKKRIESVPIDQIKLTKLTRGVYQQFDSFYPNPVFLVYFPVYQMFGERF